MTFILLVCLVIIVLPSCNNNDTEQNVYIGNGKIMLGFNKKTGAFLVFHDLVSSHDFFDENIAPGSPWEVDLFQSSEIGRASCRERV